MNITNHNNILEIKGTINADSSTELKSYVENLWNQGIVVSVDVTNIDAIDLAGFSSLVHLKMRAKENGAELILKGKENPSVKKFLYYSKMDFIFS